MSDRASGQLPGGAHSAGEPYLSFKPPVFYPGLVRRQQDVEIFLEIVEASGIKHIRLVGNGSRPAP